jgi:biofilm PGA synthesis lipoprotein PgaB
MKTDLFSRVVNQLRVRGMHVYAWMPTLDIVLPNKKENDALKVQDIPHGEEPWYTNRLSPFNSQARRKLVMLYEDVAAYSKIDGIIFQDDGYLNDFEDFSAAGRREYLKITGGKDIPYAELSQEKQMAWSRVKTKALLSLTEELKNAVLRYRPYANFARTLYASTLLEPESEEWLAQNYADSLKAYDYVVIMAYPYMEGVAHPKSWLAELVRKAKEYPQGLEKTVFKVQAYDWKAQSWIDSRTVNSWLRVLAANGARHLAYYPDNYTEKEPDKEIIRLMMATEDFPFKR